MNLEHSKSLDLFGRELAKKLHHCAKTPHLVEKMMLNHAKPSIFGSFNMGLKRQIQIDYGCCIYSAQREMSSHWVQMFTMFRYAEKRSGTRVRRFTAKQKILAGTARFESP